MSKSINKADLVCPSRCGGGVAHDADRAVCLVCGFEWAVGGVAPSLEYEYRPYTSNPDEPEWAGRSLEECEELIREHSDPRHWINEPQNDDLSPVVGYRTYCRIPASPWVPAVRTPR